MGQWQFNWITDWDEVWSREHIDEWYLLLHQAADHAHVFATPTLVRAWVVAASKHMQISPLFLWAESSDGVKAFLPLIRVDKGIKDAFESLIQPVGLAEFDYHDPVFSSILTDREFKDFAKCFYAEVENRWLKSVDRFILNGIRNQNLTRDSASPIDVAPIMDIRGISSGDDLLGRVKASLRGDIRRQIRRLEKAGNLSFKVLKPSDVELALKILPELLEQHAARWPNSYRMPGFHEHLIRESLPEAILHLSELHLDDEVISRHLGFVYQERFYWYLPVYNPAYQGFSPGKLHLFFCMCDAIRLQCSTFDFLRGDEAYKDPWKTGKELLYEIRLDGNRPGNDLRKTWTERMKPRLQRMLFSK